MNGEPVSQATWSPLDGTPHDDEAAALAALATLPDATPTRTDERLRASGDPALALEAACEELGIDPAVITKRVRARGTRAFHSDDPRFPIPDDLPDRPAILIAEGDVPGVLAAPRVAVVGTRSATPHGLADAREIGAALATAGITVVSGLAIGIDAAAHEGALDAASVGAGGGVVGVVATGLDIVYPRRHEVLFSRVRSAGLLMGEHRFGITPTRFRFPIRNRIIAGLADAVVVVEAKRTGGARITAELAMEYGRPVLAVPGSRRNPAAAGTNALIADGAHPLLEPDDVLVALGLSAGAVASRVRTQAIEPQAKAVLDACGGEPATADQLVARTGLTVEAVASALGTLERAERIRVDRGYWWPR